VQYNISAVFLGTTSELAHGENPTTIYMNKLSALIWCMRVVILKDTLPTCDWGRFRGGGDSPLHLFKLVHDQWLVTGKHTAFHYVHTLRNYGMAASRFMGKV